MIKYIIVDDEPIAHRIIEDYCNDLPHLELQENCYDALQAMQCLNKFTVDIMFLDIHMPKLKGFDFLKTLTYPPRVIVTTAYKEFALEGYELNVCDYLLKPFSFERFVKAVNKAISYSTKPGSETITGKTNVKEKQRLFIKGDKKYYQVNLDDILFIEAYGNYSKVFLNKQTIVTHQKISSFIKSLPSSQFLRLHRSFIVAIDKINLIEGNRIIIKDHNVPIGQMYKMNVNFLIKSK